VDEERTKRYCGIEQPCSEFVLNSRWVILLLPIVVHAPIVPIKYDFFYLDSKFLVILFLVYKILKMLWKIN
jgi:hypothetical protein